MQNTGFYVGKISNARYCGENESSGYFGPSQQERIKVFVTSLSWGWSEHEEDFYWKLDNYFEKWWLLSHNNNCKSPILERAHCRPGLVPIRFPSKCLKPDLLNIFPCIFRVEALLMV